MFVRKPTLQCIKFFKSQTYTHQSVMANESDEIIFDEFGNPINGSSDDSSESESDISMRDEQDSNDYQTDAIVLAEDRTHYPTLSSVFSEDVETIIATSDAKSLNDPIVKPDIEKRFMIEEAELPQTTYSKEYLYQSTNIPERIRNVALCGNVHSGKTSLLDMLVKQTHTSDILKNSDSKGLLRYTDNHILEQKKGISIKTSVMSLLLPNMNGNTTFVNFIDAPGHTNFCDEMALAIRNADITMLCVDVVESVTKSLELSIEYSLKTNTQMTLVLTKIDRLILELRLSPLDAYYKIRRTVEQVNQCILKYCDILDIDKTNDNFILSPELDNVCFSSSIFGTIFSLRSFTQKYIEHNRLEKNAKITIENFSVKLWGDIYYADKKFFVKPKNPLTVANSRTFITFVLNPIYKIVTSSLALDAPKRQEFLEKNLRLNMKKQVYKLDSQPFFQEVFSEFLGAPSLPLVNMLLNLPSPILNNQSKLAYLYNGPKENEIHNLANKCDADEKLVAYVSKLVDTRDTENFYGLVRVVSGSIKSNQIVQLLGEDYSPENTDDYKSQKISKCYLWCGRYKVEVPELKAGTIGLISGPGIDSFIVKTATIYDTSLSTPLYTFKTNDQMILPVFKVALQAYNPKDLNRFLFTMKKINRSYIGCEVKVEDNGEHSILGYGELYMDCLLHDFRKLYGDIDIKVSDPMVRFSETTDIVSKVKLVIKSNNGKNCISITAEPLDLDISKDISNGTLDLKRDTPRQFAKKLRDRYKWDSFAARSVWALGPGDKGTCILCDDTLPEDVDKSTLLELKTSILKGFHWAVNEGPLCDEPINNVKFNIIDIHLSEDASDRNDAQIIQMVQKACHAAILVAIPQLLEPMYFVETICHVNALKAMGDLIIRRRGFVTDEERIEGTPLWKVMGYIPVIESVGFETDLRLATRGQSFPQMIFSKWDIVPGNPLDENSFIPLLKRAPVLSTSRDFMVKTRKRKGLSNDVSLQKYVDNETWNMLQELEIV